MRPHRQEAAFNDPTGFLYQGFKTTLMNAAIQLLFEDSPVLFVQVFEKIHDQRGKDM